MIESSADEPPAYGKYVEPAGRDVPADDSPVPAGPATVTMGADRGRGRTASSCALRTGSRSS